MTGTGRPIPCSTSPAGFQEAVTRHFDLMEGSARFVLGLCSEGMGVDPSWFYDMCDETTEASAHEPSQPGAFTRSLPEEEATSASVLRLMQYDHATEPATESDGTKVLCEDHLDNGLVTLSLITANPSLEIYRLDGSFHMEEKKISGKPNEVIVWVGEQMDKITNGYYKPVRHRVLQPSARPPWYRVAMPFFLRGRPDAVVNSTLAKRIKSKRPGMLRKFETITMRELAGVDAAKAMLREYLQDRREMKSIQAMPDGEEKEARLAAYEASMKEDSM